MQAIDLENVETIYTPGGAFDVQPNTLETGGVAWITGHGGTYRFTEKGTKRRIAIPVGAVVAVAVKGEPVHVPETLATESAVSAAYAELLQPEGAVL